MVICSHEAFPIVKWKPLTRFQRRVLGQLVAQALASFGWIIELAGFQHDLDE